MYSKASLIYLHAQFTQLHPFLIGFAAKSEDVKRTQPDKTANSNFIILSLFNRAASLKLVLSFRERSPSGLLNFIYNFRKSLLG